MTFTQQAIGWGPGARSTTPLTPNLGQQPPSSGNLLICIVFAGGSPSAAWNPTLASGSGWTRRLSISNDPANTAALCGVAVFTKISAGTELYSDQTFSIPSGWTGEASIHEVFGSNGEVPEITGTWSGGTSAIARTGATVSVATTAAPTDSNEYVLAVYGFWSGSGGTASYTKSANMTQVCDRDDQFSQQYHWFSSHYTPSTLPLTCSTAGVFTDSSTVTIPGSSVACGLILGWKSAATIPSPPVSTGQIYPATYPGGATRTSGQGTLNVQILNSGALLAVSSKVSSATISLSGISDTAGITAGWVRVMTFVDSANQTQDLYVGYATGTGATTINLTYSSAIGATAVDTLFAEFYAGTSGTWARDGTQGGGQNNASSSTWTWPSFTAARAGEVYLGRGRGPAGGPFRNFSPNGVNVTQDTNNNPFIYWQGLSSGAVSGPSIPSLNATASYTGGALIQTALTWTLSGSSASASSTSGTLSLNGALTGSSSNQSSANGAVITVGIIAGSATGTAAANGTIVAIGGISASSTPTVQANGALTGISTYALAGTSSPVVVANGTVTQIGVISGTSPSSSFASGSFVSVLTLSGSSATASTGQGWFPLLVYAPPPSAGSTEYVWVELLDSNLVSQGIIQFVNVTAQLYYNAVGSWTITVPYTDSLWNMIMSGDFCVNVNWRGLFTFGGKCEQPGYVDSIPGASGSAYGAGPFITLSGADYLALVANRIAYPSPGVAWNAQTAGANDPVSSVHLESAIKHYVSNNMGSATTAARRHSLLDIAADLGRGANVSYTVKFGSGVNLNLLDVIRALITSTGNGNAMGVQIIRNASAHRLTFDVYIPRNLTGQAWFSQELGNLTAINFGLVDPTVTDALVQGSGTAFVQATASGRTQWNVIEQFTDSSSETDINNLNSTAQSSLLQGAAGPTMNISAIDIPYLTFGRDYYLGDIVSVEVRSGAVYSDVVTGVTLTADPTQTPEISVVPTIGQNASSPSTDQTIIGQLTARIRRLEQQLATRK